MRWVPLFLFWSAGFLGGCQDDGTRYHHYCAVPEEGWKGTDTLRFELPAHFTYHKFDMEIGVRHSMAYPYQDLWLAVIHPNTPVLHPDTVHVWLSDNQGNWLGEGTSNCFFQRTMFAGSIVCFPADSVLQVVSLMKDSVLKGVSDVGIRLLLPGCINAEKHE